MSSNKRNPAAPCPSTPISDAQPHRAVPPRRVPLQPAPPHPPRPTPTVGHTQASLCDRPCLPCPSTCISWIRPAGGSPFGEPLPRVAASPLWFPEMSQQLFFPLLPRGAYPLYRRFRRCCLARRPRLGVGFRPTFAVHVHVAEHRLRHGVALRACIAYTTLDSIYIAGYTITLI